MTVAVGVGVIAVFLGTVGSAQEKPTERTEREGKTYEREIPGTMRAEDALATLKRLEGSWRTDWETRNIMSKQPSVPTVFRPASCGTVLLERMNPDPAANEPDLFNVYHLDGPDLIVTHYCAMGNQPKMRLDRDASTPDNLVFRFMGASNLGRTQGQHMRLDRISILDSGEAIQEWSIWDGDKHISSHRIVLSRSEAAAAQD